jgi:hypothetical protein
VKPCVSCLFLIAFILCVGHPVKADQSSANDFGGQIISGVDGRRVGIGTREPAATLDVYQGELKIGSTGAACTKELSGALRSVENRLQFCDGAGWRNVSLDKAK